MSLPTNTLIALIALIVTGPPSLLVFLQYIRRWPRSTSSRSSNRALGTRPTSHQHIPSNSVSLLRSRPRIVRTQTLWTRISVNTFVDLEAHLDLGDTTTGQFG